MVRSGSDANLPKQILVVDDDESVLSFLSFSLRGEGFIVLEARSAEVALEMLKGHQPDLILLDVMLPGMSGLAMCEKLRDDSRFSRTPVLLITAYADTTSLKKVSQAGAQGLIEKPIMFSELNVQILDALAGRFSLPTRLKYAS
jgi:CheY-like chemotaxis protein